MADAPELYDRDFPRLSTIDIVVNGVSVIALAAMACYLAMGLSQATFIGWFFGVGMVFEVQLAMTLLFAAATLGIGGRLGGRLFRQILEDM